MCLGEREREGITVCLCVFGRERERGCNSVSVCVWEREREREGVTVCMCMFGRERERERERERV